MQELDDYLDKVKTLPPAPRILPELLPLLQDEGVDSSRVVELISYDPGLTAGVLRVSNAACFAGACPVDSLSEAVARLGFHQIYRLVVATTGSKLLSPAQPAYGLDSGELWRHSVAAAVAAQHIAQRLNRDENLAFTATLLHDIGKVVLAQALDKTYAKLVEQTRSNQTALIEAEKELLGVQHAEIGGRLLARWNFPSSLVGAVWHHHEPALAGNEQGWAALVYLGNMIAYFMGYGYGHQAFALRGRSDALEILELKPEALPEFMIGTFDKLKTVECLINLNAPPGKAASPA